MLKLHDFECKTCGETREELLDVPPSLAGIHCPRCTTLMSHVIVGGRAHIFKPFMHPHLGEKPVLIDSWKRYKSELARVGGANELAS